MSPVTKVKRVKTIWKLLKLRSIAASASIFSSSVDLRDVERLALTVAAKYHASATAGITVYVYSSYNDRDWDTDELVSFEPSFTADATVRKTVYIDPEAQEIKVKVTNKDTSYAVSQIDAIATLTKEELRSG